MANPACNTPRRILPSRVIAIRKIARSHWPIGRMTYGDSGTSMVYRFRSACAWISIVLPSLVSARKSDRTVRSHEARPDHCRVLCDKSRISSPKKSTSENRHVSYKISKAPRMLRHVVLREGSSPSFTERLIHVIVIKIK